MLTNTFSLADSATGGIPTTFVLALPYIATFITVALLAYALVVLVTRELNVRPLAFASNRMHSFALALVLIPIPGKALWEAILGLILAVAIIAMVALMIARGIGVLGNKEGFTSAALAIGGVVILVVFVVMFATDALGTQSFITGLGDLLKSGIPTGASTGQ